MKGIILDIDGVLRRGKDVIPGSVEAVNGFIKKGFKVCYLTNNSTRSRVEMRKASPAPSASLVVMIGVWIQ